MQRNLLTILIVASSALMENLDGTVIATSLPAIAADIHVNPLSLKLALTAYLLSIAVLVPASGWASDRFGARTVFSTAIVIFTIGSILCGTSHSLLGFVLARLLQGCGGAMMSPVGRLVVFRSVPRSQLISAFSWLTIPSMIGPIFGPPLGGFITTFFDWRWIFWINVPIGIVGTIMVLRHIENIKSEVRVPLDVKGFILCGIGFSGLVFGMTVIGRGFVSVPVNVALILIGAISLGAYYFYARTAKNPILDLKLMKIPTFSASITGGTIFQIGVGATPFLLPLLLQVGFGMSAFQSGSVTLAGGVGSLVMKFAAARAFKHFGFRNVMAFNAIISGSFVALIALFTPLTPIPVMISLLLFGGFFRSLEFTGVNLIGFSDIDNKSMSAATSFSGVSRQVSQAAGVAVGAAAVESIRSLRGEATLAADDFGLALVFVGLLTASASYFFFRLPANAGANISGNHVHGGDDEKLIGEGAAAE